MLILLNKSYLQALDKITTSNHWITLVLMFLLFGIVLLKAINLSRLKGSIYSLLNINFIETESEEKIQQRIDKAHEESERANEFDTIVINSDLNTAKAESLKLVTDFIG